MPAAVITNVYKVSDNGTLALIHVDGANLGATQNGSTATFFGAAVTVTHWENTYIEFETSLTNVEQLIKNFTDLADVPQNYTDAGGKTVTVKVTADGLDFSEAAAGGSDSAIKYMPLAEAMPTAGTVAKLWSDGRLRKIKSSTSFTDFSLEQKSATDLPYVPSGECASCYIGNDKVFIVYKNGSYFSGKVISNVSTTPQFSAQITIAPTTGTTSHPSVCYIGNDSVYVAFSDVTVYPSVIFAAPVTNLNGTPTVGARLTGMPSINSYDPQVCAIATGEVLLVLRDGTNSPAKLRGWVIHNAATSQNLSSEITGFRNAPSYSHKLIMMENDKAFVAFEDHTASRIYGSIIENLSTAPQVYGQSVLILEGLPSGSQFAMQYMRDGAAVVGYRNGTGYLRHIAVHGLLGYFASSHDLGSNMAAVGTDAKSISIAKTGFDRVHYIIADSTYRYVVDITNALSTPSFKIVNLGLQGFPDASRNSIYFMTACSPTGVGLEGVGSGMAYFSYTTASPYIFQLNPAALTSNGELYVTYTTGGIPDGAIAHGLSPNSYARYLKGGTSLTPGSSVYVDSSSLLSPNPSDTLLGIALTGSELLLTQPQ